MRLLFGLQFAAVTGFFVFPDPLTVAWSGIVLATASGF